MNLTKEQLELDDTYNNYVPFKTIVIVYKLSQDKEGKIGRNEWFRGLYTSRTNRGLMLIPLGEHGYSENTLCAQFVAYPQYSKSPIQFRALKSRE